MKMPTLLVTTMLATAWLVMASEGDGIKVFDPRKDLLSLHYDHAPDKDDGHSAAADRTILESLYGREWVKKHVVAVSGAYGKNAKTFNPKSDAVMDAAWNDCGGWLAGHGNRDRHRRLQEALFAQHRERSSQQLRVRRSRSRAEVLTAPMVEQAR